MSFLFSYFYGESPASSAVEVGIVTEPKVGIVTEPKVVDEISPLLAQTKITDTIVPLEPPVEENSSLSTTMKTVLQLIQLAKETNMKRLRLYNFGLKELPVELFELSSLTQLDLSFNELVTIPKEIGQLSSLIKLNLHNNKLVCIPKEVGQLGSLTYLNLNNNQLLAIPKGISQLRNLTELYLDGNNLVNIPKEIGQLNSLTALGLVNNQLVNIPKEIGQLSSLTKLDLGYNQLVDIPKEIGLLKNCKIYKANQVIPQPTYQFGDMISSVKPDGSNWTPLNSKQSLYIGDRKVMTEGYVKSDTNSILDRMIALGFKRNFIRDLFVLVSKENYMMTGSFPLQVKLGVKWDDSDIDFFGNHEICGQLDTLIRTYYKGDFQYLPEVSHRYNDEDNLGKLSSLKIKISNVECILNFITYKSVLEPEEYIEDAFDLSFCKARYDGKHIYLPPGAREYVGYVCGFHDTTKLQTRVNKYSSRGFTIYENN
jgi:hypothetical protein